MVVENRSVLWSQGHHRVSKLGSSSDRHREAMVERLKGHVRSITDRLVGEGDMNPSLDEAYQFIVSQHTVPVEKVRALLDFLRKKPPEAFNHFQATLCEVGCGDLAASTSDASELDEAELGSLPAFERISSGSPASVERARQRLKISYKEVPVFRRSKGESSKDLCSEWTGKKGGVEEVLANALVARQVNLCDLWQPEYGGKKPDAVGTAGLGKMRSFTLKAAHEWCRGGFWEGLALVRSIRCRDKSVWRAGTVSELFGLRELGLSAEEEREVEAFITDHSEQVALVCDGLDEGSVDKNSFLWRILCGECLPGLRLIVTAPPCSSPPRSEKVRRS